MKTYHVALFDKKPNKFVLRPVEGMKVTIPGFEAFSFFAHRVPDRPEFWRVSEATTGAGISDYWRKRKHAVEEAQQRLTRVGAERIKQSIEDALSKIAATP